MSQRPLSRPDPALLAQQAEWVRGARSRLLRSAGIARRKRVLDLGAGYGAVTGELVRRSGGPVVALDHAVSALGADAAPFAGAWRVGGNVTHLPFAAQSFDLVFSQLTLLWVHLLPVALDEVRRVLMPGGVFLLLEPDYGGMIEYPPSVAVQDLWVAALARAGADPWVARQLPGLLAARGFDVQVTLFDRLHPPDIARFAFLHDLPLTDAEREQLKHAERDARQREAAWGHIAHLPFFLIKATCGL